MAFSSGAQTFCTENLPIHLDESAGLEASTRDSEEPIRRKHGFFGFSKRAFVVACMPSAAVVAITLGVGVEVGIDSKNNKKSSTVSVSPSASPSPSASRQASHHSLFRPK